MALRDRLDLLSRGEIAGLIVVLVVLLGGAGLWYARSLPKPVAIEASTGASLGQSTASASATPVPLIVDVAGAVHRPGVYRFVEGDRIVDAIERAGGPLAKADLSLLNLAAPLTDGTQILVPKAGVVAPGASTGTGSGTAGGLININSATAAELEALSGIGEVLAATIVEYRTQNGPFASVDDLLDVSGIGPATLEEIRDQVTV
jgi:competence protein ComEA